MKARAAYIGAAAGSVLAVIPSFGAMVALGYVVEWIAGEHEYACSSPIDCPTDLDVLLWLVIPVGIAVGSVLGMYLGLRAAGAPWAGKGAAAAAVIVVAAVGLAFLIPTLLWLLPLVPWMAALVAGESQRS